MELTSAIESRTLFLAQALASVLLGIHCTLFPDSHRTLDVCRVCISGNSLNDERRARGGGSLSNARDYVVLRRQLIVVYCEQLSSIV